MPKAKRPKIQTLSLEIPGNVYLAMAEIARAADVTPAQVIQVLLVTYLREIKRHANEPVKGGFVAPTGPAKPKRAFFR